MRSFRIDLETFKEDPPQHPASQLAGSIANHPVRFQVVFYKGYAQDVESTPLALEEALSLIQRGNQSATPEQIESIVSLLEAAIRKLGPCVPDATTLQASRARRHEPHLSPDDELAEFWLLEYIGELVDAYLPSQKFKDYHVNAEEIFKGTDIPIRTLSKAVVANYVARKLNSCSTWMAENWDSTYLPVEIEEEIEKKERLRDLTCQDCVDTELKRTAQELRTEMVAEV